MSQPEPDGDVEVIRGRCPNRSKVVNQRDDFCSCCGYVVNPAAKSVSLRKAIVTVVAALYLPVVPVLAMAYRFASGYDVLRSIVFWPVAWLMIAMESQAHRLPSEVACLLPLFAMLIAAIRFAQKSHVTLVLTAVVLAVYSSLQALIAVVMLWSIDA